MTVISQLFKAGFSANLVIILVLPFTGVLDTFKKFEKISSGGLRYLPFAYNRLLAGPYCRCEAVGLFHYMVP